MINSLMSFLGGRFIKGNLSEKDLRLSNALGSCAVLHIKFYYNSLMLLMLDGTEAMLEMPRWPELYCFLLPLPIKVY